MGFWANLWNKFGKTVVAGISDEALAQAVKATKKEISSTPKLKAAEKKAMKAGVDLLRQRVQEFVSDKVK
jgi:hypothetical protein